MHVSRVRRIAEEEGGYTMLAVVGAIALITMLVSVAVAATLLRLASCLPGVTPTEVVEVPERVGWQDEVPDRQ